ncbi:chaperone NapD [Variovorax sp.]|uniref:chaperone NapD n=1 Tax=Variovorax sp. TaxID=1871043 RepID=UPI002D41D0D9|nr:chaperone NapD [Variovorax sp.]HYP83115.1 chaperone NapD [Variovorax sp.]
MLETNACITHAQDEPDEWHIAGVVVHAHPAHLQEVRRHVAGLAGAEIHAVGDDGKLIITLEAASFRAIASQLDALHAVHGVLSAALVYQHGEDAASMDEEIAP